LAECEMCGEKKKKRREGSGGFTWHLASSAFYGNRGNVEGDLILCIVHNNKLHFCFCILNVFSVLIVFINM
jgi:hypothetical protein